MKRLILAAVVMVLLLAGVATVAAQGPQTTMRLLHVLVDAVIDGDLTIGDDLTVTDDGAVGGDLNVTGTISAGSTVSDGTIADNLIVTGTLAVSDTLTAVGDVSVGDDIDIVGDLRVGDGTPTVTQNGKDAYIEGTFEVDGAAQLDGTLAANGLVTVGAGMNHATGAAVTIADGGTVNCGTRTVCELTAAGDVGAEWGTAAADGRIIYLFNSAAHTIVITDSTGSLQATGNLSLAQWDAVQLVSDGTNWIQAAAVVNN